MVFRRDEEDLRVVTDADEAQDLVAEIREHAAQLRDTPGLLDGALEEIHRAIERLLREYARVTRRRLGPFTRDLEAIVERTQDLEAAGRLSPRHVKLVRQALQHARRVHFYNVRKVLAKLDKALAGVRAWQDAVEAYRRFYRRAGQRVRDAERSLHRLRSVPRPAVGPDEVSRARGLVEACNRSVDDAWAVQTRRPVTEVVEALIAHPDVEGLGLFSTQEFVCLREIGDLLEADDGLKDTFGPQTLAELVETSGYSVGKWDRVYPQASHARKRFQELFRQLRPVVHGTYGAGFDLDLPVTVLERRLAAWRQFPGSERAPAWDGLAGLLSAEQLAAIQEGGRVYAQYGDLATRAWHGDLVGKTEAQERELATAQREFAALPDPDTLVA